MEPHREIHVETALIVFLEEPALNIAAVARSCFHRPRAGEEIIVGQTFPIAHVLEGECGAVGRHLPLLHWIQRLARRRRIDLAIAEGQTAIRNLESQHDETRRIVTSIACSVFVDIGLIRIRDIEAIVGFIGNGIAVFVAAHADALARDRADISMA